MCFPEFRKIIELNDGDILVFDAAKYWHGCVRKKAAVAGHNAICSYWVRGSHNAAVGRQANLNAQLRSGDGVQVAQARLQQKAKRQQQKEAEARRGEMAARLEAESNPNTSEYEQARLANMRRNDQRLHELGLL